MDKGPSKIWALGGGGLGWALTTVHSARTAQRSGEHYVLMALSSELLTPAEASAPENRSVDDSQASAARTEWQEDIVPSDFQLSGNEFRQNVGATYFVHRFANLESNRK